MKSMTGFGAAQARAGDVQVSVEVRSVNQRHLDIKLNLPREYGPWESELRRQVSASMERGRAEIYVGRSVMAGAKGVVLQKGVAAAYARAYRELKRELRLEGEVDLSLLAARNDVFGPPVRAVDADSEIPAVRKVLARALAAHGRERAREGADLKRDMRARVKSLGVLAAGMRRCARDLTPRLRERLEQRLAALLAKQALEPARLAQEAALLADRADVTEELVRLDSHLKALGRLTTDAGSVGKRIEFLVQEINRELNTIGSKANDLEMTNLVVDAKADLEKIREQVQNVE